MMLNKSSVLHLLFFLFKRIKQQILVRVGPEREPIGGDVH